MQLAEEHLGCKSADGSVVNRPRIVNSEAEVFLYLPIHYYWTEYICTSVNACLSNCQFTRSALALAPSAKKYSDVKIMMFSHTHTKPQTFQLPICLTYLLSSIF